MWDLIYLIVTFMFILAGMRLFLRYLHRCDRRQAARGAWRELAAALDDDPARAAADDAAGLDPDGHPQIVSGQPADCLVRLIDCHTCGEFNYATSAECRRCRSRLHAQLPDEHPALCVARQLGGCVGRSEEDRESK